MTPWEMFLWGYEAGVRSGHAAGYAEGVDVLRDALGLLASYELGRHPSFRELERRRATPGQPYDTRTPEQIRTDAHASWGYPDGYPPATPGRGRDGRPDDPDRPGVALSSCPPVPLPTVQSDRATRPGAQHRRTA